MRFVASALGIYSFVFHLTLSAFLLGLAAISYHAGQYLQLTILPFPLETALRDATLIGVTGLLVTLLAITRWFKVVFLLWSALMIYLMAKGFFFSTYAVSGNSGTRNAALLTFGAIGAFLGAAWSLKYRRRQGIL